MKKDKNTGFDKKIKRALRTEIEGKLNKQMLQIISEMGYENKRSTKAIAKNARALAKRLALIISENEKSVKGVPMPDKESDERQDKAFPEFSAPQPLPSQDSAEENPEKKPVVPSDSYASPTALDLAEKISEA